MFNWFRKSYRTAPDRAESNIVRIHSVTPEGQKRFVKSRKAHEKVATRTKLTALNAAAGTSEPLTSRHGREYIAAEANGIERRIDKSTIGVAGEKIGHDVVEESVQTDGKELEGTLRIIRSVDPSDSERSQRVIEQAKTRIAEHEAERTKAREVERQITERFDRVATEDDDGNLEEPLLLPTWTPRKRRWLMPMRFFAGFGEFGAAFLFVITWLKIAPNFESMAANPIGTTLAASLALVFAAGIFVLASVAAHLFFAKGTAGKVTAGAIALIILIAASVIGYAREQVFATGEESSELALYASMTLAMIFGLTALACEYLSTLQEREKERLARLQSLDAYGKERVAYQTNQIEAEQAKIAAEAAIASRIVERELRERQQVADERQLAREYETPTLAFRVARLAPNAFKEMAADERVVDPARWTRGVEDTARDSKDSLHTPSRHATSTRIEETTNGHASRTQ